MDGIDLTGWGDVAWGHEWDKSTGIVTRVKVETFRRKSAGYDD